MHAIVKHLSIYFWHAYCVCVNGSINDLISFMHTSSCTYWWYLKLFKYISLKINSTFELLGNALHKYVLNFNICSFKMNFLPPDANVDLTAKKSDITTFRGAFECVIRSHYPTLVGHIHIKLVSCPSICTDSLSVLSR